MIKVTVWNENVQENGTRFMPPELVAKMAGDDAQAKFICEFLEKSAREIKVVHPNGIHNTLKDMLEEEEDMVVRTVTMDMPECGLTQEVLDDTDVLVWWAHVAHDRVPDEIAMRVKQAGFTREAFKWSALSFMPAEMGASHREYTLDDLKRMKPSPARLWEEI